MIRKGPKLITKLTNFISPEIAIVVIALLVGLVASAVYINKTELVYAVEINGIQAAVLKSKDEAQSLIDEIKAEQGQAVGQVAFTQEEIVIKSISAKKQVLDERDSARKALYDKLNFLVKGYAVAVDDKQLFVLSSRSEVDNLLQKVKDTYALPEDRKVIETVAFGQKVEVVEIDIKLGEAEQTETVFDKLIKGQVNTLSYQIQQGDTLWTIARKNDMYIKDLLDSNPGLGEQNLLKIGKKIDIVKVTPYLDVIVKGTQTREEIIPISTVYQTDNSIGFGQTKTVNQGAQGAKDVSFRFVSKNGVITEKVVLSEAVKQNPVNKVIAKGPATPTVTIAASRGSGSASGFVWPFRGPITSGYGYRWGSLHPGIDIDGETGNTFYAAQNGVVVQAAWDGGYGKCIIIDHGNGVRTLYGHASAMMVGAGQRVSKGQAIGLMGSTGNSTGSHLHFEIIVNGSTVNPLNYL